MRSAQSRLTLMDQPEWIPGSGLKEGLGDELDDLHGLRNGQIKFIIRS